MLHIHGGPPIGAGYVHEPSDLEKTRSAVRATYRPGVLDRITNRFARGGMPRLAKFAHDVRSIGLNRREAAARRQMNSARERFDLVEAKPNPGSEELRAVSAPLFDRQRAHERLATKQALSHAALDGTLHEHAAAASQDLQHRLASEGMLPLSGLRATPHANMPSRYLVSQEDGHRIKINSERPPLLARLIANGVSKDYDTGASGPGRAMRSTMQHALVGIYSAEQSMKGKFAGYMAKSERLDAGARARMDVRAARSVQNRANAQAALGGNVALNNTFRRGVAEQAQAGQERLDNWGAHSYDVRESSGGIKPPQTRYLERRADAYLGRHDGKPPHPAAGAIVRFALKLATVRAHAQQAWHAPGLRRDPDSARHGAGVDKAQFRIAARRSAMHGMLVETLRDEQMQDALNRSFPEPADRQAHASGSSRDGSDDGR